MDNFEERLMDEIPETRMKIVFFSNFPLQTSALLELRSLLLFRKLSMFSNFLLRLSKRIIKPGRILLVKSSELAIPINTTNLGFKYRLL